MADDTDPADLQVLRRANPDRYLSILYAPAERREALAVLYRFDAEIVAIRDRIHEALPGEIRLQWWRDALAVGAEGAAGHPLAVALSQVIDRHGLPRSAFDRYLEARIFDLYDDPMPSRGDLEGYCGETVSAIIQLAALVLEPEAAPAFASAAGHAGCAQGIAGILRLLPLHRSRGQCFVPADILAAAGSDREAFIAGKDDAANSRVIAAMVELGRDHVARFEAEVTGVPTTMRAAFLPAALALAYIDRASVLGARTLQEPIDISAIRRHWTLLRRASGGWG